uniref:CAAX prenyl protease 2/Lysostaphin resistance protein A-like domain-containing protein n=1 Tax=Setaria italica TaxID=4555 RepID=K3YIN7_SETIT
MASPPCLLRLRPCPPSCLRSRSRSQCLHLSKQSLHPLNSPRPCLLPVGAPVAERLVPRPPGTGRWTGIFACRCSYDAENGPPTPPPDREESSDEWPVLRRWDVPWEWPTISLTMVACAVSSTTVVVLGSIFGITNTFRPFSDDIFRYKFEEPLKLQNGWLLWAGIGLLVAIIAIALAGAAMTFLNGETPQRETDSLVILLPLIGSSGISTACLLGITGILAPILEETVFRGFLMVSLTMWFSTPYAVLITAAVFAFAHLTPGEFPQLFVLGVVLGFSYAQTRNLLTPITIHAVWNSGVILLLTFLQLQGYDIKELLQAS